MIYHTGVVVGKKYKSGMEFAFTVAVPSVQCERYALLVEHDGINDANVQSMFQLAEEGRAPYCVCVGVTPAFESLSNGEKYNRRINSYDLFNSEYGDFLVYELIPYIEKTYHIRFYEDPDMHYICGASSGGISSFVVAWFHPEYFHRIYMGSPSFLAMGRGNEIPYLIRKYETKPFRIYQEYSENEPNDYFGAIYPIDVESKMALEFAGYDFTCEYFPGEGHSAHYRDFNSAYKRNTWIWKDYSTKKIVAPRNSPRIEAFLSADSKWEQTEEFPKKSALNSFLAKEYSSVVESADKQLFYVGNTDDDIVYAYVKKEEISVEERSVHGILHTIPCVSPRGVIAMDVDGNDRLYVLTAIGIQCVRSFGLIDAILDLPKGKPLDICVTDSIYVKTDLGVFKRALKPEYVAQNKRLFIGYYD